MLNMKLTVFIASVVLIVASYLPYIVGIFRRKIFPHPITWLVWSVVTAVLALVMIFNGGGLTIYSTWLLVLIDVVIFASTMALGGGQMSKLHAWT
jgi:hypothetical protein